MAQALVALVEKPITNRSIAMPRTSSRSIDYFEHWLTGNRVPLAGARKWNRWRSTKRLSTRGCRRADSAR
jgi:hypothetical protein